jgi:AcrR family transcriptional regulator
MPKAFTHSERKAIRAALLAVGMTEFERRGIRQTRIEDICRSVGIAKGSFYAFFPSREELFMTIVEEREALHMRDMLTFIEAAAGDAAQRARGFFDLIMHKMETDPILNLVLAHGEIPHLVLKLGAERFAAGHRRDRAFAREAARRWSRDGERPVAAADLIGLMTIALSVAVQRAQMTPRQYRPTVALLRSLFVTRLTGAVS